MLRVSNAWVMQASDEVADTLFSLRFGRERKSSPAVDSVVCHVIVVPDTIGTGLLQSPDGARNVAHVVTAHDVMLVTNAIRPFVTVGQQQADHLEAACRQHDLFTPYRRSLSIERLQRHRFERFA